MKKGLLVLLFAVLISGLVFAGTFTGSAGIEFGVDFDEEEWGFANTTKGKYSFNFELDTTKVAIGEEHQTDVWAELAAEATAYVKLNKAALASSATNVVPKYTAKITKANIHIGDVTIGILNAGTAGDYVTSYYDDDEDGDPDYDVVAGDSKLIPGFTVSYKDWNAGFGAEGVWDDDSSTTSIWAHAETPAFKFGENEEFSVEAGAYAAMYNNDKYVGGGFKAAYAADKLSADIGTDLVVKRADVDFGFEAAANATYDFVTLNVYAASGTYFSYADEDPVKLDAKLSAAYKFDFNEDVALDVTGFVEVRDALVNGMLLSVGATEATTIDAFKFEFAETADFWCLANKDVDAWTTLEISAKVTYTHEKFSAYAKLVPAFIFDTDDNTDTVSSLAFECGISSDKVVEGAVLALTYKGADFIDFEDYKGAVTASCTINF